MQCDHCHEELSGDYISVKQDDQTLNYHQYCVRCSKCNGQVGTNIYFSYPSGKAYCGKCRNEKEKDRPVQQKQPAKKCCTIS
jgi:hypothetical protein